MIRLNLHPFLHFDDGHRRCFGEQFGKHALVPGREMLNHDVRQPRIGWQCLQ